MKPFKLLAASPSFASCSEGLLDEMEQAGIEITHLRQKQKLHEADFVGIIQDYDGLIVGADIVSRTVMEHAPRLKIISKHGIGLDNIDLQAAEELGIKVCYAAGSNTVAVAELACAMIMTLARGLVKTTGGVASGEWNRSRGVELMGASLGVLGTGAIGREVIKRMAAFGMRIQAFDPYPNTAFVHKYGGCYVEFDKLLQQSDFITLHLPLTAETCKMIAAEQLSQMKPGAFLVNAARGGIVDEAALYQALLSGRLAGAGIDTFEDEPPTGNPLLTLDNVVLSPHLGGYTKEAIDKMSRGAAANILSCLQECRKVEP